MYVYSHYGHEYILLLYHAPVFSHHKHENILKWKIYYALLPLFLNVQFKIHYESKTFHNVLHSSRLHFSSIRFKKKLKEESLLLL